jgi:hypothetical protein
MILIVKICAMIRTSKLDTVVKRRKAMGCKPSSIRLVEDQPFEHMG